MTKSQPTHATDRCEAIRPELGAFRAGEGTPLQRGRIEAHLSGCEACRASLELESRLLGAARSGPESFDDVLKQAMWRRLELRLGQGPKAARTGPTFHLGWLLPATALAGVAVLITFRGGLIPWGTDLAATDEARPSVEQVAGARFRGLTAGPGVEAVLVGDARAEAEVKGVDSRLRLHYGMLVASFTRPTGGAPLEVVTPELTVLVRGTLFMVEAGPTATQVGVSHGRVEVHSPHGIHFVEGGELLRLDRAGAQRSVLPATTRATMLEPFPAEAAHLHEVPSLRQGAGQSPPRAGDAAPDRSAVGKTATRAEGTTEPSATESPANPAAPAQALGPEARLAALRAAWRRGEATQAQAGLEAFLAEADLEPLWRDEALYLLATIQRAQGNVEGAAATLARLADSPRLETARLAQLERARLLLRSLGQPAQARQLLVTLTETKSKDAVAEQAGFELCALLIETGALNEAHRCLSDWLMRFPTTSRRAEAEALLGDLENAAP